MIGGVPFHSPFSALRVCSSLVVPEIAGSLTLVGVAAVTSALAGEVAGVVPAVFLAVTVTLTVLPTSAGVSL